jgi:exopolysaccharide production protein ExoY
MVMLDYGSKRAFDILFSLVTLITFSPLFVLLGIFIKINSPGPAFYRSWRVGMGGRLIGCWKFRTMVEDAEDQLQELTQTKEWRLYQKVQEDPRVTPIGRFLRRTSLDELPQFWNVLLGDLSIVGPRAPTIVGPKEMALQELRNLYGPRMEVILSVRPGITGVWQVSGRSQISFAQRCRLDWDYVITRTFWRDLVVIAKTIPVVLFSKGAC